MKRWCTMLVMPVLLLAAGCMTTGVQVADADLAPRQIHSAQRVEAALGSFLAGLDKCGVSTKDGALMEIHHGIAECSPPDSSGMVICDVFLGIQLVGPPKRTDLMLGRLHFRPAATGSDITIGVQTFVGRRDRVVDAWEKLVRGQAREVCPKKFRG